MKKLFIFLGFISSSLFAQTGFSNWECLYNSPEASEIFLAGGSIFTAEVNAALNEVCLNFELEEEENSTEVPDGAFITCNGEFIEIDLLNFNEDSFNLFLASLDCAEFYEDSVNVGLEPETGFSNWECLYNSPEASEIFLAGGSIFTAEVNAALNEVCSTFEPEELDNSPEVPDGVFITCNGEFIEIDTLNFNQDSFNLFLASLDCAEFYEDSVNVDPEVSNYFSWDCIYNYPEASALYLNFGDPEASAELEEFCLAVANGDWMWGEDPAQWPITCEEGSSIATVEFETAGFGYQEEISWSLAGYDGTIGLTPVCIEDGCSQFNMFDSWGDGWGGITFSINSPDGVLLTGSLDDGFVESLGFGVNTNELCFEVTEVENPDAFTCFEDVFPGIGSLPMDSMYPNMNMTGEDLFFVIEATEFDFSILAENGIEYTPQEIDGYLVFGPINLEDVLTFLMGEGMDNEGIVWGYFRPAMNEVVAQGMLSKDEINLPTNFSYSYATLATVVDVIVGSPDHTTLASAVTLAGLIETLSSAGPFTVFAPTDAAFDLIPEETLNAILADPSGQLTSILTHHVHAGLLLSTDLTDQMMIPTVNGSSLEVTFPMEMVQIDGAIVTTADLQADNGVVHVIDAVLLPNDLSIADEFIKEDSSVYLFSIDVLGKRVAQDARGIMIFDMYSSGKVVKRFAN